MMTTTEASKASAPSNRRKYPEYDPKIHKLYKAADIRELPSSIKDKNDAGER